MIMQMKKIEVNGYGVITGKVVVDISKGKVGYPWESTREIYQHISPIYELYNGCIGQYGAIFWEQLLGYPPKGTQLFLLNIVVKMISLKQTY